VGELRGQQERKCQQGQKIQCERIFSVLFKINFSYSHCPHRGRILPVVTGSSRPSGAFHAAPGNVYQYAQAHTVTRLIDDVRTALAPQPAI
jgi:hypothetical protein